jgi:hypothetical protein
MAEYVPTILHVVEDEATKASVKDDLKKEDEDTQSMEEIVKTHEK